MADWLKRIGLRRVSEAGEERQTQAAYQAAIREAQRRRERINAALDLEGLMDDMKEARER